MEHSPQNGNAKKFLHKYLSYIPVKIIYNNCMLKTKINKSNSSSICIYNNVQIMGGSLLLLKDKKRDKFFYYST